LAIDTNVNEKKIQENELKLNFFKFRPFRTCLSLLLLNSSDGNEYQIQQHIFSRANNVVFFLNRWTT